MKKFFNLFIAIVTVFAVVSCGPKDGSGDDGGEEGENRTDPYISFTIKPFTKSANITITPHNVSEDQTYVFLRQVVTKSFYEANFGDVNSNDEDEYLMQMFMYNLTNWAQSGQDISQFFFTGSQDFAITDLDAKEEYVVFAAFINPDGTTLTGEIFKASFVTKMENYKEVNFQISVNGTTATIIPDQLNQPYVYVFAPTNVFTGEYVEVGSCIEDYLEWDIMENCANALATIDRLQPGMYTVDDFSNKGKLTIDLTDPYHLPYWKNYCTVGSYYTFQIAAAAVDKKGYRISDITVYNCGEYEYLQSYANAAGN